jgi:hypothetical protein
MSRYFSFYPRFLLLLGFALSLFGLSMYAPADAQAAITYIALLYRLWNY